jgi:hypothetical protein
MIHGLTFFLASRESFSLPQQFLSELLTLHRAFAGISEEPHRLLYLGERGELREESWVKLAKYPPRWRLGCRFARVAHSPI